MKKLIVIVLLLAAVSATAQTVRHFGATESDNTWSGKQTFQKPIIGGYTVATLPASPSSYQLAIVTNGSDVINGCTAGGGSAIMVCWYYAGAWHVFGSGGSGGLPTQPVDVGVTYNSTPTASLLLINHPFPFAVTIPASCAHSHMLLTTAATGTWVGSLQKNDAEFGTVSCTTTCTFSCSATSFAEGDVLTLVSPGSPDATAANFGGTIYGTRVGGVE